MDMTGHREEEDRTAGIVLTGHQSVEDLTAQCQLIQGLQVTQSTTPT